MQKEEGSGGSKLEFGCLHMSVCVVQLLASSLSLPVDSTILSTTIHHWESLLYTIIHEYSEKNRDSWKTWMCSMKSQNCKTRRDFKDHLEFSRSQSKAGNMRGHFWLSQWKMLLASSVWGQGMLNFLFTGQLQIMKNYLALNDDGAPLKKHWYGSIPEKEMTCWRSPSYTVSTITQGFCLYFPF